MNSCTRSRFEVLHVHPNDFNAALRGCELIRSRAHGSNVGPTDQRSLRSSWRGASWWPVSGTVSSALPEKSVSNSVAMIATTIAAMAHISAATVSELDSCEVSIDSVSISVSVSAARLRADAVEARGAMQAVLRAP